ncbi:MAG: M1 family aminopeptidase [Thiolinea sp.]
MPRALVYLQQPDPELAERYLKATQRYIKEYSELLGAYPYDKFVTVESFWETGWGMPSFTLLGSRVMRLPFILHSSFPHEILHNWWGNGVYVDAAQGNWSEGLTAYLADHRNKETAGEAMNYRRDALQKYAAFAAAGGDFPLREFRSRHDRTTQAVGYDKSLMLFHMLRKRLGDEAFFAGLRQFYQSYRFRFADFQCPAAGIYPYRQRR